MFEKEHKEPPVRLFIVQNGKKALVGNAKMVELIPEYEAREYSWTVARGLKPFDELVHTGDAYVFHLEDTEETVRAIEARWDKPVEHGLPYAANNLGVICSKCCKWADNKYRYCPNCGAYMKEDDE